MGILTVDTVGKFSKFLATLTLRGINLADLKWLKTAVLTTLNFDSYKKFTLENVKSSQNSNFRDSQMVKMAVFGASK